jgi:hypothetical protein
MSLKNQKQSFMTTRLNPIFPLILLIGLTAFISWNDDLIKKVQEQLDKFKSLRPQEKVYLHTDKPHYSAGETIWFKAYLVEGQLHLPSAPSNIVYVDLVDPSQNVMATRNIKIEEGGGAGDFTLDTDLSPGTYSLRAYTNYMRNFDDAFFFKRDFQLFDPYAQQTPRLSKPASSDFTAQFFPEGGDLVEGLSATVAVKTVGADGKGVDVKGKILDGNGQQVAFFKSLKFGMGFFSFMPQAGERYTAEVSRGVLTKTFQLPNIQNRGYVLKVDTRKQDLLKVRVQTNIPEGLDDAFVIAHMRGNVFGILQGKKGSDAFEGELQTTELPNGIAHFTLFNRQGEAVCERLVFINNPDNQVNCQVETNAETYDLRSEVEMEVKLKDLQGEPLQGNVSVTVTDEASTYLPEYGEDIRTYLLLNSDLRGRIENPGYYFEENSAGSRMVLDLLMMTQGWRRFDWAKLLADEFPRINHPLEQGFALEGTVTKLVNNNKSVAADVFISVMGSDFVMDQVRTEEDGEFLFLGLNFQDTTDIILQANLHQEDKKKKKNSKNTPNQVGPDGKRNVDILLSPWYPHKAGQEGAFSYPIPEEGVLANFLEDQKRINVIDSSYAQWSINLDEIVVKARRQETSPELKLANARYREPDHRMIIDSVSYANTATDIFQLIRGRFPGVQVRGAFPNEIITMRGVSGAGAAALILVDGLAMDAETVATINPNDVAVIDILKGASAAFYGSRAINGVVAIYTRQLSGFSEVSSPSPGIINMKHPGYYQAREFYAPTYDKKQPEHIKPDFRTTLFWDPVLKMDKKGEAKLSFYTSDKRSSYRIVVEGITEDGRPVTGSTSIEIR